MRIFNDQEKAILRIVQKDLPDSPTPFADIAKMTGASEDQVLELLAKLKKSGAIRRFGASLRHQKTEWVANAMVAWLASREEARKYAPIAAAFPEISHIYYRPPVSPAWPYGLYTMIHGRSEDEYMGVISRLAASWPLKDYAILRTLKELKKISMTYF